MLASLDDLRQILVFQWCVVSVDRWDKLVAQIPGLEAIIDHLGGEVRFHSSRTDVQFITPELRNALFTDGAQQMLVHFSELCYLKLRSLGAGAQGEVWVACPCNSAATPNQLVALKLPNPAAPNIRDRIVQLQSEMDILSKVDSPHIACLVAANRSAGVLATQLVDGETLESKIHSERRLSVSLTVQIGIDICQALEALHAENWIHKDVKPGNIILDAMQRAVLIDFGLAEIPHRMDQAVGTPYYIAPEVFFPDSTPDARADVFSLAATMYHLLSGQPPRFQHCLRPTRHFGSRAELDAQSFQFTDAATECDLEDLRREVPRQLCQLLVKGLSIDRDHRPASAFAFRESLQNIQAKFHEAIHIEHEFWALAEVLLEALRGITYDPDYTRKERENADTIRIQLEGIPRQFPALRELKNSADSWTGMAAAYAVIPRTIKIITKLSGLANQLNAFLKKTPSTSQLDKWNDHLRNLVVRTLEGIRSTSFEAVGAAHDWRTVLLQLGLIEHQPKLPTAKPIHSDSIDSTLNA